jgi:hypothetical protein
MGGCASFSRALGVSQILVLGADDTTRVHSFALGDLGEAGGQIFEPARLRRRLPPRWADGKPQRGQRDRVGPPRTRWQARHGAGHVGGRAEDRAHSRLHGVRRAALSNTLQGKKQSLVLWKRVKPPGPDFTGIRPWSSGQKMYNNVYFVTFFVLDESKLESHKQLSYNYDIMSTDAALAPDGAAGQLASLLKTLGSNNDLKKNKGSINTVDQWYEGATLQGEYASETSPPVLLAVCIIKSNKYCTWFRRFNCLR